MGDAKGKGAGGDAAALQAAANMQGIQEIRRQFDLTKENVDPFITAGQEALPEVQRGASIGGFGDRLKEIFSGGGLDPLIKERTRNVEGSLASKGLNRSGFGIRQLADIPAQLGFDIENMLFGRQAGLSEGGRGTALQLGSLGQGAASNVANLFSNTGQAQSSGSLLDAQSKAAATEQIGSAVATVLPLIFGSDPDLKENIEEVGEIKFQDESKSLKIYQWDWIDESKGTFIEVCPNMGFMADEVEEKFPERVEMFGGFKMIAYFDLLDDLEAQNDYEGRRVA
jgi:hypothetical protein